MGLIDDMIVNERPPFSKEIYEWKEDRLWKIIYLVSNGYGGSKIVSKWSELVKDDSEIAKVPYENERKY